MTTLKLKKGTTPPPSSGEPRRGPLRSGGLKPPRPTLAQAQAERARQHAEPAPEQSREQRQRPEPPPEQLRSQRQRPEPALAPKQTPSQQTQRQRPPPARAQPRLQPGPRPAARPAPQQSQPEPLRQPQREPQHHPEHDPQQAPLPRLSKRMSELGLASRREADEWIAAGFVSVDGVVVDQLGARVHPGQHISVAPQASAQQAERVTVLLHKPLGVVSGQAEDGHQPALTLVTAANRWTGDASPQRYSPHQLRHLVPAGRLDLDSSGLLVLTQDGRIAKFLIGEDSLVEKEYVVHVRWTAQPEAERLNDVFPAELLERLRHGLVLDGVALAPAKVSWQNECHLRVVLRQGRKRQIRRMCEAVGLQVLALKRIRIGRVYLGELPPGQWRYLGPHEHF